MKESNKIMIFDYYLGGHHIEYLHHIYNYALHDDAKEYTFVIPSNIDNFLEKIWDEQKNIKFLYFDCNDREMRSMNVYKKAYFLVKTLNSFIKQTGIKNIVLIETIVYMPYLPLLTKRGTKITSIIYSIPLYKNDQKKCSKLVSDLFFWLIGHSKKIHRAALLNCEKAVVFYNKKYNTDKFFFLPDPYNPIEVTRTPQQIRNELSLNDKKIFLHFGGITKRKGTLEILDAIELLNYDELKNKCFIFAGRVIEDIKELFYIKTEKLKNKAQIIIYDKFCEYSFLGELCSIADCIIIPYKNIYQSSGVLSYAAQYNVTLIGPATGVLGEITKKYNLGITIEKTTPNEIKNAIIELDNRNYNIGETGGYEYIKTNSPAEFASRLLI